jgi:hypothetical protein
LKADRAELRRRLDWRRDVAGMPAHTREELVDEAIAVVVMSSKPICDEQHLQGAFWTSVGYLLAEYRAGRRELRVGSRPRVEFEPLAEVLSDDSDPFDLVAARERIATAVDLMAQLDPFEQRVMAVMAAHGLGVKLAAKALGEPIKTVLAASRSAERKLDQVAAIAAAGRMCDYREQAIHAHAHGSARAEQEKVARAHLAACAGCRSSYATLLREIEGREFQRAAIAAFLPPVALAARAHGSWIERLTTFFSTGRGPSGTAAAERTAGVLGGGGLVKAAAVSTALVIAGAGVGAKVIHSLAASAPARRHGTPQVASSSSRASIDPTGVGGGLTAVKPHDTPGTVYHGAEQPHRPAPPPPPSKDLQYLELGRTPGQYQPSAKPRATTATNTQHEEPEGPAPPPTRTGGGTGLGYLGQ